VLFPCWLHRQANEERCVDFWLCKDGSQICLDVAGACILGVGSLLDRFSTLLLPPKVGAERPSILPSGLFWSLVLAKPLCLEMGIFGSQIQLGIYPEPSERDDRIQRGRINRHVTRGSTTVDIWGCQCEPTMFKWCGLD
jgi:hypothetical protein